MKRGILLAASWALALVLLLPSRGRTDPPPDCTSCNCAMAVAWYKIAHTGGGTQFGPTYVLKEWDAVNQKAGNTVPHAKWKIVAGGSVFRAVYATDCLINNNVEVAGTYKQYQYSDTWPRACTLTGAQSDDGYTPVTFDPNSVNFAPDAGTTALYTCGAQGDPG